MTTRNDITGDLIHSMPTEKYKQNYDAIFGKDKQVNNPKGTHDGKTDKVQQGARAKHLRSNSRG